ncbi:MAG: thioesterase family protein [Burkholderiaceae bacterium]
MSDSYFVLGDDGWILPTDHCRGPWHADSCHAGPPSGMVARAMEHALRDAGSDQRLTRLTLDLLRPIPMSGFRIEAGIVRAGRSTTTLRAVLLDEQGRERVSATAMALRVDGAIETVHEPTPVTDLASAQPGEFSISRTLHGLPAFPQSIEVRYPPGEDAGTGPTTLWLRTVPLLAHEQASGFQRICPLADCGNALSRLADPWEVGFVNPDLTIALHREPRGEWFGSQARSHWARNGTGLADALLFDETGPVGRALQTLLLTPAG